MTERRLLQIVVAIACIVPIAGGAAGVLSGVAMLGIGAVPPGAEAHFRYLSGLLLAIGLAFLVAVPRIEAHAGRFRLLAAIVMAGGLSRLFSVAHDGAVDGVTIFALAMELGVTPALAIWQGRVAKAS